MPFMSKNIMSYKEKGIAASRSQEITMDLQQYKFERITELVTLLANYEFEPTIRKISEVTETSLAQTREDLGQLHRKGIRIFPEEIAETLDKDESRYDDDVLGLDMELPTDQTLLYLDSEERDLFRSSKIGKMLLKDTPYSVPDAVKRHAEKIRKAVGERSYIRFRYRSPMEEHPINVEIAPYMLFHNTTDDLYYCITFDEKDRILSYRLDRILYDVHAVGAKRVTVNRDKEIERLKYVWGAAFQNNEEPAHVKLEITANTANIVEKIRNDVRDRVHGRLRQEGDKWVYEDEVIGLASFRAWVMMYGSSVKVLEPVSLAEEIRESSRIRLLNYEDGGRFHH